MKILKFLLSVIVAVLLVSACNTPPAETTAEESEDATEYTEDGEMTEDGDADGMDTPADGEEPPEAEGIDEMAGLEGEPYYTHEITGETVYTFLLDEEKPTFNGDMKEFLQSTIDYPKESRENGNEGTIIVDFVVGKDGYVKDAHVIKPHEDVLLNNEAIRVVNAMPQWNPAVKDGAPVAYKYVLPIHFKLMD